MHRQPFRSALTVTAMLLVGTMLAACSSSASSSPTSSSTSNTAATTTKSVTTSTIPAGTTLRIGDQLNYLKTVLSISGEDKNLPYTVQYDSFVGGPPMLQAFQAGALDAGFIGSTPLIFAQAAKQSLVAVAAWASKGSGYSLLTAPGNKSVTVWSSLKGKRVAYQQGTAGEAVLLEGLSSAGLSLSDVTTVNIPQTQVSAALEGGSADAGISIEPLTSVYLKGNPTAHVVTLASAITDRSSYIIAPNSSLTNSGTAAALADYLVRLVKAFNYLRANPEKVVQAVFVGQYGLSPARAAVVQAQAGVASFIPIPGAVLEAQQHLADLFYKAGQIPAPVQVGEEFDSRFNKLLLSVQHG